MLRTRPEELGVYPASFYDKKESKKYHQSSRITHIQNELTNRAIELLALPEDCPQYILDIGCGSGLSGLALEKAGHYWTGCDISPSMLAVATNQLEKDDGANGEEEESNSSGDEMPEVTPRTGFGMTFENKKERKNRKIMEAAAAGAEGVEDDFDAGSEEEEDDEDEDEDMSEGEGSGSDEEGNSFHAAKESNYQPKFQNPKLERVEDGGDVLQVDMGQGLPFRPGTFDGAISISALQWVCYASSSDQDPMLRLNRFFSTLYTVLKRDAKAILQFYPENAEQVVLIAQAASRVGFAGGVLVDYPNSTKAKKYFLCLSFERSYQIPDAKGIGGADGHGMRAGIQVVARTSQKGKSAKSGARLVKKSTEWIKKKKDRHKKQGKDVKGDSKFTGRRRARGF